MIPNDKYKELSLEFWANIKLLNQRLGYAERKTKRNPNPGFVIPTMDQIKEVFEAEDLDYDKLIHGNDLTDFGKLIQEYLKYRGDVLINHIEPNLMNKDQAKALFEQKREELNPACPLPIGFLNCICVVHPTFKLFT